MPVATACNTSLLIGCAFVAEASAPSPALGWESRCDSGDDIYPFWRLVPELAIGVSTRVTTRPSCGAYPCTQLPTVFDLFREPHFWSSLAKLRKPSYTSELPGCSRAYSMYFCMASFSA